MKKLLCLICALVLCAGLFAQADSTYRFEHVNKDYFIYPAGTDVVAYAKITYGLLNGQSVNAQLIDQTDGTVMAERVFSDRKDHGWKFTIPSDWTGRHDLAVYVDGEKCSDDYPVIIREDERCLKRVDTEEKKIAVTVDCGAGGNYNLHKWLELLEKYDAKCTFFITGSFAEMLPEGVKDIKAAGHEIGNHSYSHCHTDKLGTWKEWMYEIEHTSDILEELTGERPTLFRVPYGDWTYSLKSMLRSLGFKELIQWNISSGDSASGVSWGKVRSNSMPGDVPPGSIILFHNDDPYVDRLDEVLDYYTKTLGYKLVPVSELMYDNYYVDDNFVMHEIVG